MKLKKGKPIINEPFWKHPNNEKEIMMNTYIKKEDIGLTDFEIISCNGNYKMALKLLLDKIERLPAADVRPVVLCKDCKHRPVKEYEHIKAPKDADGYIDYKCPFVCDDFWYNRMPTDDNYCSYGEKKEE